MDKNISERILKYEAVSDKTSDFRKIPLSRMALEERKRFSL